MDSSGGIDKEQLLDYLVRLNTAMDSSEVAHQMGLEDDDYEEGEEVEFHPSTKAPRNQSSELVKCKYYNCTYTSSPDAVAGHYLSKHAGLYKYKCTFPACASRDVAFTHVKEMGDHLRQHHPGTTVRCMECADKGITKSYTHFEGWHNHDNKKHPKKLVCPHCGTVYWTSDFLSYRDCLSKHWKEQKRAGVGRMMDMDGGGAARYRLE